MTVVVGHAPERGARGALRLAAQLARSRGELLVVASVIPQRWRTPSMAKVDAEYAAYLDGIAASALDEARAELAGPTGDGVEVEYAVLHGRSAPSVLVEEAERRSAGVLVVGPSTQGTWGHVAVGSVSDRLVHSSPVPLALAPRGYRTGSADRVRRVTVGLDGTAEAVDVLVAAARVAAEVGASLRLVTYAVRGRTMHPPEVGLDAEELVVRAWREQSLAAQDEAAATLAQHPDVARPTERGVVEGTTWADAIEATGWDDGDVLVIGSSHYGPVARVFLGSSASRIVRNSPVPVVVVPRGVAAAAAEAPAAGQSDATTAGRTNAAES